MGKKDDIVKLGGGKKGTGEKNSRPTHIFPFTFLGYWKGLKVITTQISKVELLSNGLIEAHIRYFSSIKLMRTQSSHEDTDTQTFTCDAVE